jgi:hypothetical protein
MKTTNVRTVECPDPHSEEARELAEREGKNRFEAAKIIGLSKAPAISKAKRQIDAEKAEAQSKVEAIEARARERDAVLESVRARYEEIHGGSHPGAPKPLKHFIGAAAAELARLKSLVENFDQHFCSWTLDLNSHGATIQSVVRRFAGEKQAAECGIALLEAWLETKQAEVQQRLDWIEAACKEHGIEQAELVQQFTFTGISN